MHKNIVIVKWVDIVLIPNATLENPLKNITNDFVTIGIDLGTCINKGKKYRNICHTFDKQENGDEHSFICIPESCIISKKTIKQIEI